MKRKFVNDNQNIVSKRTKNQAGYLVLPDCVIARSGILQYSDVICEDGDVVADGELIQVYRPPKAIKECYKQFANLPLTLRHPKDDEVNPENARGLVIGSLGSNPRYEEKLGIGYIICDIIVYDIETQKKIEAGEFEELSAGYETAFRKKRGTTQDGHQYEAEQFLLTPNHVALVERGRCGSECRVCDHEDRKINQKQGDEKMARKKATKTTRYFLPVGDGEDVIELSPEQVEKMKEKDPDFEMEDIDESEVQIEETEIPGTENEEDEDPEDGGEVCPECGKKPCECENEEGETTEEDEEPGEGEGDEGMTFSVSFEDGSIGKMDKVAYDHCQRFLEVSKRGDSKDTTLGKTLLVTAKAQKVLGDAFDIEKFTKNDEVDIPGIKRAVVRKVMPDIVVKGLKNDALDMLFNSACATHAKKKDEYEEDITKLDDIEPSTVVADSEKKGIATKAKEKFLSRLHGTKK